IENRDIEKVARLIAQQLGLSTGLLSPALSSRGGEGEPSSRASNFGTDDRDIGGARTSPSPPLEERAGERRPISRAAQATQNNARAPSPDAVTRWITAVVRDLQSHSGKSIVIAGEWQPPIVHALVHAI